jgi:hypothetical protein
MSRLVVMSVRVPPALLAAVDARASELGWSRTSVVQIALAGLLDQPVPVPKPPSERWPTGGRGKRRSDAARAVRARQRALAAQRGR